MPPVHQVRERADGGSAVGPLARAAELELRLREEALRRERAESRAQNAEAMAEVASSRLALLEARAAATAGARAADVRERDRIIATLRRGLEELGGELDAVRALALLEARAAATAGARAADVRERDRMIATLRRGLEELGGELDAVRALALQEDRPPVAALGGSPAAPLAVRTRSALDPSIRMGELARGARELLAGGRLEAADEVIRGLEDAAERLRAQAPPAPEGA